MFVPRLEGTLSKMRTKVYYQNSMILTWRNAFEALHFRYPDAENVLVIVEYAYDSVIPSASFKKEKWYETFSRIEEVDVHTPNLLEEVKKRLLLSNKPWIILCTEDYEANKLLLNEMTFSFVSMTSREIDVENLSSS